MCVCQVWFCKSSESLAAHSSSITVRHEAQGVQVIPKLGTLQYCALSQGIGWAGLGLEDLNIDNYK